MRVLHQGELIIITKNGAPYDPILTTATATAYSSSSGVCGGWSVRVRHQFAREQDKVSPARRSSSTGDSAGVP